MTPMETSIMDPLPDCDFCEREGRNPPEPAKYDAMTRFRRHGYMCQEHFDMHGLPIGTRLVKPTKQPPQRLARADRMCKLCGNDCPEDGSNKLTQRYRILDAGAMSAFLEVAADAISSCDEFEIDMWRAFDGL